MNKNAKSYIGEPQHYREPGLPILLCTMVPSAMGKIWGLCPWSKPTWSSWSNVITVGWITTFRHEIFQLISAFSCAQIYALLADFTCFFQCFYNVTNLMPDFVQLLLCPLPVGPIVNRVNHHFVQLLLCLLPVGSWVNHHFVQLLLCPLLFGSLPFSPLPVGQITICSKYQLVQLPLGPLLVNSIATWSNCQFSWNQHFYSSKISINYLHAASCRNGIETAKKRKH
jgi:hypothetical protein